MMQMQLLSIITIACLIIHLHAAEWSGIYRDSRFPGMCTITPTLILNEGVRIKDPRGGCGQIICGYRSRVVFQTCGVSVIAKPCRYGAFINSELDYPNCCERKIICD